MIKLPVIPRPAPRQTRKQRSDWYPIYKQEIFIEARQQNFELGKSFEVIFIIPMPPSWKGKREKKNLTHHDALSGPDLDNLLKGFVDALLYNDSRVWGVTAIKLWGYEGAIFVKNAPRLESTAFTEYLGEQWLNPSS